MRRVVHVVLVLVFGLLPAADAQSLGVIKPAGKEPTLSIGGLLQVQF